jgi:myo-inositol-1(or 4)-monophosphatase
VIKLKQAQSAAITAARSAGALMRRNFHSNKRAHAVTQHDIKLDLDVRAQELIERALLKPFPEAALLGEEGISGDPSAHYRWVVDPIDGTVNYAYQIPHASVSIALQQRAVRKSASVYEDGYETVMAVVYDPFFNELWTAIKGQPARLDGKIVRVSKHTDLAESIISIGFAKTRESLEATLPYFHHLVHRVRKLRMMGSAALGLAYVASGRFDAYIEGGLRLWDIAGGGLILECAGGDFRREPLEAEYSYRLIASNGGVKRQLALEGK